MLKLASGGVRVKISHSIGKLYTRIVMSVKTVVDA